MRRFLFGILMFLMPVAGFAQSFTFEVDVVSKPKTHLRPRPGIDIAKDLFITDEYHSYVPPILTCSFAEEEIVNIGGEDVLFQMLLRAWCQHRPVVLSPDAIWMVIAQGLSYYVNKNPDAVRGKLVSHEGKEELKVYTYDLFSEEADWAGLIDGFVSEIGKFSSDGVSSSLVADFSTTGINERIASEITLMDVVKPYFDYTAIYVVCGIPSVTLTGTPEDWQKVLDKTRILNDCGLGWWASELEPVLNEFIKASQGVPDISFWKDMVKKTRPQTIVGPTCSKKKLKQTEFDGWFLKLFPFDGTGRTPGKVTITQSMLRETVCVPFKYDVVDVFGNVISETDMELVAGIVGVTEDVESYAITPKIGWLVRIPDSRGQAERRERERDSLLKLASPPEITMASSVKYWNDGALRLNDFSSKKSEWPKILNMSYGVKWKDEGKDFGNTTLYTTVFNTYMSPYSSWIHPDYKDERTLRFLQTAFDYVEICKRRAQAEIMSGSSFSPEKVVQFHMDVADSFFDKMKEETLQGQDTPSLNYYSGLVASELARTEEFQYTDLAIHPKYFGIGIHSGVGSEFYTGPVTEYITHVAGINLGMDLYFRDFNIYIGGLLGWGGRLKQAVARNGFMWDSGKKMTGGNMELSLGYTIFDSQRWKVAPYAGVGVGFIIYPENPVSTKEKTDEIDGFRYQAGLCADWKFRRFVNYTVFDKSLAEFSLRTNLYVAHTAFPSPAQAWSINFGVSVNMLARKLFRKSL